MSMTRRFVIAAAFVAAGTAAQAQTTTARIRGTFAGLDGNTLSVTTREGPVVKITMSEPLTVLALKKLDATAAAKGAYIGTAAEPLANGEFSAHYVFIFPENARGTAEGHFPWDLTPTSTMTNATVDAVVHEQQGNLLTLVHKNGTTKVHLPPGAPVVSPIPAAREDLKQGVPVFAFSTRAADGTLSATRIYVAKDGVAPPM